MRHAICGKPETWLHPMTCARTTTISTQNVTRSITLNLNLVGCEIVWLTKRHEMTTVNMSTNWMRYLLWLRVAFPCTSIRNLGTDSCFTQLQQVWNMSFDKLLILYLIVENVFLLNAIDTDVIDFSNFYRLICVVSNRKPHVETLRNISKMCLWMSVTLLFSYTTLIKHFANDGWFFVENRASCEGSLQC
jgi:hypothetical protein